jgi:hypothetical protein
MGIWKLDRDWVQADLEAVSLGVKPGARIRTTASIAT